MEFDIVLFKQDIENLKNTLFIRRKATYRDISKRANIEYNTLMNIINERTQTPNCILFHQISTLTGKSITSYLINTQIEFNE